MSNSLSESFTDAWNASSGDDFASQLERQSLMASAQDVPELQVTLNELQKPVQERLRMHITGAGVHGHSTPAKFLADLYSGIHDAAKAIAQALHAGSARWQPNFMATAPTPGSLNIEFAAPTHLGDSIPGTDVATVESQALRTIANLFAQAENGDAPEEALTSTTSRLPPRARTAVRRVANAAARAHWNVETVVEARGRGVSQATLTAEAALRLVRATKATAKDEKVLDLTGTADGWTWSTGSLRFIPTHGKPFAASVPAVLQTRAAKLVSTPDTRLRAKFLRTQTHPEGSTHTVMTSHELQEISEVESPGA